MKTMVFKPSRISIGDRSIINECCLLDGRGGLGISSDVSISIFSKLITGSHDAISPDFQYVSAPITIQDHVWVGADGMILGGVEVKSGSIIAAKAVLTKTTEVNGIYAGVPAKKIGTRGEEIFHYRINTRKFFR